jgi:hypothetical protein
MATLKYLRLSAYGVALTPATAIQCIISESNNNKAVSSNQGRLTIALFPEMTTRSIIYFKYADRTNLSDSRG